MKSERGNSRSGAPDPAQGSLRPAHMPSPGSCRKASLTITGLGLQFLLATQGLLVCFLLLGQLAFCSPREEGRGQSGGG